jgi:uncharacterized protein YkwD
MSSIRLPNNRSAKRMATALATLLALAGCGGGGGSEPSGAALPTPVTPSPTPPPVSVGTRVTCNLANFRADMLEAVNAHRRAGASCGARGSFPAAPDLVWNDALTQAAIVHSDDMVAGNFFSHTGSNGSNVGDRVTAAGYAWRGVGENIAAGQATVAVVVDGWMKSDGHCANIMNAAFRDIGVACVAGNANTTYRTYWTQDFGTPR